MGNDSTVIFVARNGHSAHRGQPPVVEAGAKRNTSYFENQYGEQSIFVREAGAATATVYGGDIGWEKPETLTAPPEELENHWTAAGLMINLPEARWLQACWFASQPPGE